MIQTKRSDFSYQVLNSVAGLLRSSVCRCDELYGNMAEDLALKFRISQTWALRWQFLFREREKVLLPQKGHSPHINYSHGWLGTTTSATLAAVEELEVNILPDPGQAGITWGFVHVLCAAENRLVAPQGSAAGNLLLFVCPFCFLTHTLPKYFIHMPAKLV